jgi:hypothetical protein
MAFPNIFRSPQGRQDGRIVSSALLRLGLYEKLRGALSKYWNKAGQSQPSTGASSHGCRCWLVHQCSFNIGRHRQGRNELSKINGLHFTLKRTVGQASSGTRGQGNVASREMASERFSGFWVNPDQRGAVLPGNAAFSRQNAANKFAG